MFTESEEQINSFISKILEIVDSKIDFYVSINCQKHIH